MRSSAMFRRATHGSRCVSGTRPRNSSSRALGRVTLSASFRRVDAPGDGFRGRNVFAWCSHPPAPRHRRPAKTPANKKSRRADSNRGLLHYECTPAAWQETARRGRKWLASRGFGVHGARRARMVPRAAFPAFGHDWTRLFRRARAFWGALAIRGRMVGGSLLRSTTLRTGR